MIKMKSTTKKSIILGLGGLVFIGAIIVIIVTLTKGTSDGAPSPPPVPCGNVVTLPNGSQAICPPGWDNRFTSLSPNDWAADFPGYRVYQFGSPFGISKIAGCDENKDQCMACIGTWKEEELSLAGGSVSKIKIDAPGPAYPNMTQWPESGVNASSPDGVLDDRWAFILNLKDPDDGLPQEVDDKGRRAYILMTNPLPLPPGMNCAASDANGVLL